MVQLEIRESWKNSGKKFNFYYQILYSHDSLLANSNYWYIFLPHNELILLSLIYRIKTWFNVFLKKICIKSLYILVLVVTGTLISHRIHIFFSCTIKCLYRKPRNKPISLIQIIVVLIEIIRPNTEGFVMKVHISQWIFLLSK